MSRRAVLLGFGGRFTDELLSGLPDVLMPALRAQFGLSYTQISFLDLALRYVAAAVEPGADLLIDVWQRRWLLAWGAAGVGLSVILLGLAPNFLFLLAAFAVYGLGSGPLAHTADVVLVEAHPRAPERIFARATMLDTAGALLSPLCVTLALWAGLSWRWLLLTFGFASLVYAVMLLRTPFPAPAGSHSSENATLIADLRQNLRAVLTSRDVWRWLLFLFLFEILETPFIFKTVWLNEHVGMSQSLVGVYRAFELAIDLVSLVILDRWLTRHNARHILQLANAGLLLLIPLWLFTPGGIWTRFILALPLNFFFAVYWPIGRAQALASAPGLAGAVTAVSALFGLVPSSLLFGLLAERMTLTSAMLCVSVAALLLLVLLTRSLSTTPATNE